MSKTKHRWILATVLGVAVWAVAFPAAPASAQTPTLDPPIITCAGATDKTITIKVCGGAVTGAPAGFSLQWVPSGTPFTEENTCKMSGSGVPPGSTFNLDPGECVDVVVAQPTGAVGETFQCTGDLPCSADFDFRAFAHEVPGSGMRPSDFTATLVCSTASCPETGGEGGCSPGFWKNRAVTLDLYDTSRTLDSVFTFGPAFTSLASKTFLEALDFRGGNTIQAAAQILLRQAVAALLNAENPSVNYPRTVTEIVTAVNGVLNTVTPSRDSILALASALDADNNLQCPLGGDNGDLTSSNGGSGNDVSAAKAAKKAAKAAKAKKK